MVTWTLRTCELQIIFMELPMGIINSYRLDLGILLISSNGINWESKHSGGSSEGLYGISYGNNIFVIVGDYGVIRTSSDGNTWTTRSSGTSKNLRSITFDNNQFITVGESGTTLTSSDGISWNSQNLTSTGPPMIYLYDVTYGNNLFVIVGESERIFYSSDGISWLERNYSKNYQLNSAKNLKGIIYSK